MTLITDVLSDKARFGVASFALSVMEALSLPHHRHGCMVHDILTVVRMEASSCQTNEKGQCCDLSIKRHNRLSNEQPWLWQKSDSYCLILPS